MRVLHLKVSESFILQAFQAAWKMHFLQGLFLFEKLAVSSTSLDLSAFHSALSYLTTILTTNQRFLELFSFFFASIVSHFIIDMQYHIRV